MRRCWRLVVVAVSAVVIGAGQVTSTLAQETVQILDGRGGSDGRIEAWIQTDVAAVRRGNQTWVFYGADAGSGSDLRLARLDDDGPETFRTLDGDGWLRGRTTHEVGTDVSAIVHSGVIHVFYRDTSMLALRHAWLVRGDPWRFETIDGHATWGGRTSGDAGALSTAAVFRGQVQVFYVDRTQGDIRRAILEAGTWRVTVVDGDSRQDGRTTEPLGSGLTADVWGSRLHVLYSGSTYEAGLREVVFPAEGGPAYSRLREMFGGPVSVLALSRTEVFGAVQDGSSVRPFRWRDGAWHFSHPTWWLGDTIAGSGLGMNVFEDGGRAHVALGLYYNWGSSGTDELVAVAPWQPYRTWTQLWEEWWWSFPPGGPAAAVTVDGVGHLFVGGLGNDIGETGEPTLARIVGPFEGEEPFF